MSEGLKLRLHREAHDAVTSNPIGTSTAMDPIRTLWELVMLLIDEVEKQERRITELEGDGS